MITLVENVSLPAIEMGKILKDTAIETLKYEKHAQDVDLSIVIEDDEHLRELNRQFRDIDTPTDVLSFQANEIDPESEIMYIGDIIISLEQAARQAEKSNHSLIAELQLLTVHGTLHLLGHDHGEVDEKNKMWDSQKSILTSLGVNITTWPEG